MRFITFVCLFISLSLNAQKWEWSLPVEGEDLKHISEDRSGNIYVAGTFNGSIKCGDFILHDNSVCSYVAKLNSSGKYIWAVKIKLVIEDLKVDNDQLYVAGYFSDFLEINQKILKGSKANAALLCYSTTGKFSWFLNTAEDCNSIFTEIAVSNNSIYLSGNTDHPTKIRNTKISDGAFVCNVNTKGNLLSVIGLDKQAIAKEISTDPSGNIYVLCEYHSPLEHNGEVYEPGYQGSHYIICYSSGKEKWFLDLGANNYYRNENMVVAANGDLYLSRMQRYGSILLSAYSSNGTFKWEKKYGGSVYDECNDMGIDQDNNLYMCGGYWFSAKFDDVETKGAGNSMFVTKINNEIDRTDWVRSAFVGEEGSISAYGISVARSSGYLIGRSSGNATIGKSKVNGLFIAKMSLQ